MLGLGLLKPVTAGVPMPDSIHRTFIRLKLVPMLIPMDFLPISQYYIVVGGGIIVSLILISPCFAL